MLVSLQKNGSEVSSIFSSSFETVYPEKYIDTLQ